MEKISFAVLSYEKCGTSHIAETLKYSEAVIIGEAAGLHAAKELLTTDRPDAAIVAMELSASHGLEFITQLAASNSTPILVVSSHSELLYAERALRAGAYGYIMADASTKKLLTAIETVCGGDMYLSRGVQSHLLRAYAPTKTEPVCSAIQEKSHSIVSAIAEAARGNE